MTFVRSDGFTRRNLISLFDYLFFGAGDGQLESMRENIDAHQIYLVRLTELLIAKGVITHAEIAALYGWNYEAD